MIDAIYITSAGDSLIYQYLDCKTAPSFASACQAARLHGALGERRVLSSTHGPFTFLLAVSGRGNPVLPYTFAERLYETMETFLGVPLTAAKLERSSDTLTLLLSAMLANGVPNITDACPLHEFVPQKSLFSQILAATTEPKGPADLAPLQPYRWRRLDIRYAHNEMFVDVCEHAQMVFQCVPDPGQARLGLAFYSLACARTRPVHLIGGTITGTVLFLLHLSGQPHLRVLMNANGKHALGLASFHPCIDLTEWSRLGVLAFVPPDGRLTLATYTADATAQNAVAVSVAHGLGVAHNEFEILLHLSCAVDLCTVEIEAADEDCKIKVLRSTHGDFSSKAHGRAEWRLRQLPPTVAPVLTASVSGTSTCVPRHIVVHYTHRGSVPSGLKVELVSIVRGMPSAIKPYKGVKYETRSQSVIRM